MFVAVCKNWLSCKSEIYPGLLLKNRILHLLPKYFFFFFFSFLFYGIGGLGKCKLKAAFGVSSQVTRSSSASRRLLQVFRRPEVVLHPSDTSLLRLLP